MTEKILVVASQPDDEILGCGGTISKKIIHEKAKVKTLILSKGVKARGNLENIKKKINMGKDIFGREISYKKVQIDNSFPKYIIDNKEKLNKWII